MQLKIAGFKAVLPKEKQYQTYIEYIWYLDNIVFTNEYKVVWDTLKDKLCIALILMHLNFSKGFILYYNGSKKCRYKATLYQKDNEGTERPILYLSKTLDKYK